MTGKRVVKPDYNCASFASGNTDRHDERAKKVYKSSSWEWPRWFDDKRRKRKVFVKIKKFYGDYHHWYVELEEEDNPFWLPPTRGEPTGLWVRDDRAAGASFSERFNTEKGARSYAKLILQDHFPDHRPIKGDLWETTKKTWHYSREGD